MCVSNLVGGLGSLAGVPCLLISMASFMPRFGILFRPSTVAHDEIHGGVASEMHSSLHASSRACSIGGGVCRAPQNDALDILEVRDLATQQRAASVGEGGLVALFGEWGEELSFDFDKFSHHALWKKMETSHVAGASDESLLGFLLFQV